MGKDQMAEMEVDDDTIAADGATEDGAENSDLAEPLDLSAADRKLVTQPYDLSVKGLSRDIESDRIRLTVEYQRKYVWDNGKASRLIESLLLNVPIPVCYFAEDESGAYEVIDGLQRLTTISRFLEDEFPLSGVSVLTELEGLRFSALAAKDQRRLENRTIRCIVITEDSNPDIKFDVFERLNTGAATLTAQELRNSVYRGEFNDQLKHLASQEYFTKLLGNASNKRMEFEELILRFFALVDGIETYKPPLRQFLNSFLRRNRRGIQSEPKVALFRDCCETLALIMDELPFRSVRSRNPVNKAIFDALMVTTAFADRAAMLERSTAVREALERLEDDEDFQTAIGRATADRRRMLYRLRFAEAALNACGVEVSLPPELERLEELRPNAD